MNARLFVDNLPPTVRESDIEEMFSMYGAVVSVYLAGAWEIRSKSTFALIDMHSVSEAELAIRHIDKSSIGGRTINVMLSRQGSGVAHLDPNEDLPLAS